MEEETCGFQPSIASCDEEENDVTDCTQADIHEEPVAHLGVSAAALHWSHARNQLNGVRSKVKHVMAELQEVRKFIKYLVRRGQFT